MASEDYNLIRPVQYLNHVGALRPVDQQQQRRRGQQTTGQPKQHSETPDQESSRNNPQDTTDQNDGRHIDYRA